DAGLGMNQRRAAKEDRSAVQGKGLSELVPKPRHQVRMRAKHHVCVWHLVRESEHRHSRGIVSRLAVATQSRVERMIGHELGRRSHQTRNTRYAAWSGLPSQLISH